MKKLKLEELNRIDVEEFKKTPKTPVTIVLDDIRSLNNVGSAFRTADAFAISKICLCGITGQPPHRDINKTALGAQNSVDWEYFENITTCLEHLKSKGSEILAIEQVTKSKPLQEFQFGEKPVAFVFGNEVNGVSDQALALCDQAIEIPQFGTKHSLNVSVTIGVVLWQYVSLKKIS